MGEEEGDVPHKLSGLQFYNQKESGEGKKNTFFILK